MLEFIAKYFTAEQIALARLAVLIITTLFFAVIFYKILKNTEITVKKNDGKYVERMLKSTGSFVERIGKYESTKLFLSQSGANYMMGRPVSPEEYTLLNIFLAIVFGMLGVMNFGIIGLVIGAVVGFMFIKTLLTISNKADNDRILQDMKGVYDTLKIKTEGGMFFISALQECYKNARNKRLKDGLRELHNEIVTKSDINAAVDNFNVKFKNKYIDTFCVIIKQALESGKSVEILRDMSDQLADMQEAINVKHQNKLEAQINVIQIMIYIGIVAVCVYGLMMSMNGFSF